MKRKQVLEKLRKEIPGLRSRFGVKDLALFGSVARNEARRGSDLDVLVTFAECASFDRFMDLKFYLEDLFGVAVDLVTPKGLRVEMRSQIEREAIHVP